MEWLHDVFQDKRHKLLHTESAKQKGDLLTKEFGKVRFEECIGCYICVEVCALLTDYDAVRMYDTSMIEEMLDVKIENEKPEQYRPAEAYEQFFAEGGAESVRELGKGSRIREKIQKEERKRQGFE